MPALAILRTDPAGAGRSLAGSAPRAGRCGDLGRACLLALLWGCTGPGVESADDDDSDNLATSDTDDVVDSPSEPTNLLHPAHRLTADEYAAAVRDLLGVDFDAAAVFPEEAESQGYVTNDEVATVTPAFAEAFLTAAREVAAAALQDVRVVHDTENLVRVEAEDHGTSSGFIDHPSHLFDQAWFVAQADTTLTFQVSLPRADTWQIGALVLGRREPGGPACGWDLSVDGALFASWDDTGSMTPTTVGGPASLAAGPHTLTLRARVSRTVARSTPEGEIFLDPGAWVAANRIDLTAPQRPDEAVPNATRAALLACDADTLGAGACASQTLVPVATRAWRRPPSSAEVARLLAVVDDAMTDGLIYADALQLALESVLSSPSFLFRVDADPHAVLEDGTPIAPWERAARLAFMVWRSLPDDALLACAAAGGLAPDDDGPCGIDAQLERLLADPRSEALRHEFPERWLHVRPLDRAWRDYHSFPEWRPTLVSAMREEVDDVFSSYLDGTEPWLRMIDARWTIAAPNLAEHYGVARGSDEGPSRIDLSGTRRAGILGFAAPLTLTSTETRTSPVRRGVWVLSTVLCEEAPLPPANVPQIEAGTRDDGAATLDAHLTDPVCISCHSGIDPYGRPQEWFDGIGLQRATGATPQALPDGTLVSDTPELASALAADPRTASCLVQQLGTWSLGRSLEREPAALVRMTTEAQAHGFTVRAVLDAIVHDPLFLEGTP